MVGSSISAAPRSGSETSLTTSRDPCSRLAGSDPVYTLNSDEPVKFSLNGDQGLEIIASAQFVASGTATNPSGEVLDTVTAGKSGLQYDPASDIYTYVWKTAKSMAKQTGRFVLTLSDGSQYSFDVAFKK